VPEAADRVLVDKVTGAIEALFHLESSRRIHQQHCAAAGVSVSRQGWLLLERIAERPDITPSELSALLDLDRAVVARLLRQLEDAELIDRQRADHDGRVSTVSLSPAGRAAHGRMRDVIWRHMREALGAWPDDDVKRLAALLARLLDDVRRRPYRPLDG
jgi:DNA-binding MarR family transcriptional regulator